MKIYTALACDYGQVTPHTKQQDGRTLGPHSLARLGGMWNDASATVADGRDNVVFVFAAGTLSTQYICLYELQAAWVVERWYIDDLRHEPQIILPETDQVWGTDGELQFLLQVLTDLQKQVYREVEVHIYTEDYHSARTRSLMQRVGLSAVLHAVDSRTCPPTAEEVRHEQRANLAQRFLPYWLVQRLQRLSRQRRARNYGLEVE